MQFSVNDHVVKLLVAIVIATLVFFGLAAWESIEQKEPSIPQITEIAVYIVVAAVSAVIALYIYEKLLRIPSSADLGIAGHYDRKVLKLLDDRHKQGMFDFQRRARSLQSRSNFVLAIIIMVLISSALFVVFAGYISRLGTQDISPITTPFNEKARLEAEVEALDRRLEVAQTNAFRLKEIISNIEQSEYVDLNSISLSESDTNFIIAIVEKYNSDPVHLKAGLGHGGLIASILGGSLSAQITEPLGQMRNDFKPDQITIGYLRFLNERITNRIQYINKTNVRRNADLERTNKLLEQTLFNKSSADQKTNGVAAIKAAGTEISINSILVAESVTRFGVAAIAIYLVQILINLYQYNTRLSAYYLAQRDTILLSEIDAEKNAAIHKSLWPDLQYGKPPRSVLDRILPRKAKNNETEGP